jgi:hypothetical protein
MDALLATSLALVLVVLAGMGFGPALAERLRGRDPRRRRRLARAVPVYDPGRERRAERRARELMRSILAPDDFAMYEELGFVRVIRRAPGGGPGGYGYLIYPHRPIVAYAVPSGELLSEYCVRFPDRSDPAVGTHLPDADDVLAKWMALHGDEHALIEDANMHLPGRHHDPRHVRRDLGRLALWDASRAPRQGAGRRGAQTKTAAA